MRKGCNTEKKEWNGVEWTMENDNENGGPLTSRPEGYWVLRTTFAK